MVVWMPSVCRLQVKRLSAAGRVGDAVWMPRVGRLQLLWVYAFLHVSVTITSSPTREDHPRI